MFTKEKQNYTQMLFSHFMTKSISQPYGYMCNGATVLTTDPKLYKILRLQDEENLYGIGYNTYDLNDVGVKLSADSKLLPNIKNAVLFSTPQGIDGLTETLIGGDYTLILINGETSFGRFTELIPTIIQHHIEKNGIDVEKSNVRAPFLHVEVSRNNSAVDLKFDGYYCLSQDFKNISKTLIEELKATQTSSADSEDQPLK